MDEHARFAFASAAETSKQLLTLATGLLGLEITFVKEIFHDPTNLDVWILEASWVLLTGSLFAGLVTLMGLTGLSGKADPPRAAAIYTGSIRAFAAVQVLLFLVGVVLSVWFAMRGI